MPLTLCPGAKTIGYCREGTLIDPSTLTLCRQCVAREPTPLTPGSKKSRRRRRTRPASPTTTEGDSNVRS